MGTLGGTRPFRRKSQRKISIQQYTKSFGALLQDLRFGRRIGTRNFPTRLFSQFNRLVPTRRAIEAKCECLNFGKFKIVYCHLFLNNTLTRWISPGVAKQTIVILLTIQGQSKSSVYRAEATCSLITAHLVTMSSMTIEFHCVPNKHFVTMHPTAS